MIEHLDDTLRHLFMSQVSHLKLPPPDNDVQDGQVGLRPPDDDWRSHVSGLGPRKALNVYLVDLRENRKLRSNERVHSVDNGIVSETPAPNRVDCHYLITAWSPATEETGKTMDEHQLLHQVMAVLMHHQPLVPRQAYLPDPLPPTFPGEIADAELPTAVLPVDGFPKYAEFWGTMGANHRWKPAIYLVVTLPVVLRTEIAGPMVTTRITEYRQRGQSETAEVWIQIAGTVTNPAGDPVSGAWVHLDPGDHTTTTDAAGRFAFMRLRSGDYTLTVRASGFDAMSLPMQVPSPGGGYDVQLI